LPEIVKNAIIFAIGKYPVVHTVLGKQKKIKLPGHINDAELIVLLEPVWHCDFLFCCKKAVLLML